MSRIAYQSDKGKIFIGEDINGFLRPIFYEDQSGNGPYLIAIICAIDVEGDRYFFTIKKDSAKNCPVVLSDETTPVPNDLRDQLAEEMVANFEFTQEVSESKDFSETVFLVFQKLSEEMKIADFLDSELKVFREYVNKLFSTDLMKIEQRVTFFEAVSLKNNKPTLLIFCDNYFIGICATIRENSADFIVATALVADGKFNTHIIKAKYKPSRAQKEAIATQCEEIFSNECIQLAVTPAADFSLIPQDNDKIKSDIYSLAGCDAFNIFINNAVSNRYAALIEEHAVKQANRAETKRQEQKIKAEQAKQEFIFHFEALKTLIEKYKQETPKCFDEAIKSLDKQKDYCTVLSARCHLVSSEKRALQAELSATESLKMAFLLKNYSSGKNKKPTAHAKVEKALPATVAVMTAAAATVADKKPKNETVQKTVEGTAQETQTAVDLKQRKAITHLHAQYQKAQDALSQQRAQSQVAQEKHKRLVESLRQMESSKKNTDLQHQAESEKLRLENEKLRSALQRAQAEVVQAKQKTADAVQAITQEKDQAISRLTEKLQAVSDELNPMQAKLDEVTNRFQQLSVQFKKLDDKQASDLTHHQKVLKERDRAITRLSQSLSQQKSDAARQLADLEDSLQTKHHQQAEEMQRKLDQLSRLNCQLNFDVHEVRNELARQSLDNIRVITAMRAEYQQQLVSEVRRVKTECEATIQAMTAKHIGDMAALQRSSNELSQRRRLGRSPYSLFEGGEVRQQFDRSVNDISPPELVSSNSTPMQPVRNNVSATATPFVARPRVSALVAAFAPPGGKI